MDIDYPTSSDEQSNEPALTEELHEDEDGGLRFGDIYVPPAPKPVCSMDAKGPRMIITHILNENFKSYYGVQKLGPFHQSFTAIVGPNGSGKSNVIDAMLFVFGYRANKIRTKKFSVLIHKSAKHTNLKKAVVTVHFQQIIDKDESYEVIPNTEVVVGRAVHDDNSSYYLLNGKKVQFKEISDLLSSFGIDLNSNRFLILQGEVEQISLMKPKGLTPHETGMLEYLEDIIGTTRLKVPLKKAEEQLATISDKRSIEIVSMQQKQLEVNQLKGPRNEAIDFLKTENAVAVIKNEIFQKYILENEEALVSHNEKKSEVEETFQNMETELQSLKAERLEKQKEKTRKNNDFDKINRQKDEWNEIFEKANNRDIAIQAEMQATSKRRQELKEKLKKERQKLEDIKKIPAKNTVAINDCEIQIAKFEKVKVAEEALLNNCLNGLKEETQGIIEKKEKLQTKLIELKSKEGEVQSECNLAESKLKLLMKHRTQEQMKLNNLVESLETAKKDHSEKVKLSKDLKNREEQAKQAVQKHNEELQTLKQEEDVIVKQFKIAREKEENRIAMGTNEYQSEVLGFLMRKKQEGVLPGLLGRLGDLGGIPRKYDVAISTAAGALENLVVEDVQTAQKAIALLKENNAGRATFIALDKQEHFWSKINSDFQAPENIPRLFDLITVNDDRVKPAMYYVLRDTLVADDINQATRIAYGRQRFRVVTLNGNLIEISGTMSGGGNKSCKGRMSERVKEDTHRRTASFSNDTSINIEDLQNQLFANRNRQNELSSMICQLQEEIKQIKFDLPKYTMEFQSLSGYQTDLLKQISAQEEILASVSVDPKEQQLLEKNLSKLKERYEAANTKTAEIQAEVNILNGELEEITGKRVKVMQKKVEEATKKINSLQTECSRLTIEIKSCERNTNKVESNLKTMENDITNCETNIRKLQKESEVIEEDAARIIDKIKDADEKITAFEKNNSDINNIVSDLIKRENDLKSSRLELQEKIVTLKKESAEIQEKLGHWRVKMNRLVIHQIPSQPLVEPLNKLSPEELKANDMKDLQYQLTCMEDKLKKLKFNPTAIEDYMRKFEQYTDGVKHLEAITNKYKVMNDLYSNIKLKRYNEFMNGFTIITKKLKEMYQLITLGGDAELDLVDTMNPFSEGINFNVRPPKKAWKTIINLSGGEKTLSSLSLVFALHYYKPSPLYVMDEIDAALDFKNVSVVANYIKDRTKNAQFIIISLRENMFDLCNKVIGIYKPDDCTQAISLDIPADQKSFFL